jgi:hypothetical protein
MVWLVVALPWKWSGWLWHCLGNDLAGCGMVLEIVNWLWNFHNKRPKGMMLS